MGAEFFLTVPALVHPTYTTTGGLYQIALCIELPTAAMQQNTDGHTDLFTQVLATRIED